MEKELRDRIEEYRVEIERAMSNGYVFAMKMERKKKLYDIYFEIHQKFNESTPKPCWSCYKTIYKWLMYIGEYFNKNVPKRNRMGTENK